MRASGPSLILLVSLGAACAITLIHVALASDDPRFLRALAYMGDALVLGTAAGVLALLLRNRRQQRALRLERALRRTRALAERDRLDEQVSQRTHELRELTRHVHRAREDERGRLARDLHDELGALLTAAKLDAARIRSRLGDTNPDAQERLAHLVTMLNEVIALKRRITEDLRPSTLGHLGLKTTLAILVRDFGERSGVQVHCELEDVTLDASAELALYRLVQEAINNITKHARASNVWVTLGQDERVVTLGIRDDGTGFDIAAPQRSSYGLVGMRFRVDAEGGHMTLRSSPGKGTAIHVRLPRAATDAAATNA